MNLFSSYNSHYLKNSVSAYFIPTIFMMEGLTRELSIADEIRLQRAVDWFEIAFPVFQEKLLSLEGKVIDFCCILRDKN